MARRVFRYVLWVHSTHPEAGAWVKVKDGNPPKFEPVDQRRSATRFAKESEAEAASILLATAYPHVIGRIQIETHFLGERPDWSRRIHDFTVNHNG